MNSYYVVNTLTGRVIRSGLTMAQARKRVRSYNMVKGANGVYAVCSLTEGGWWIHLSPCN